MIKHIVFALLRIYNLIGLSTERLLIKMGPRLVKHLAQNLLSTSPISSLNFLLPHSGDGSASNVGAVLKKYKAMLINRNFLYKVPFLIATNFLHALIITAKAPIF